jgi:hypothetical protein
MLWRLRARQPTNFVVDPEDRFALSATAHSSKTAVIKVWNVVLFRRPAILNHANWLNYIRSRNRREVVG